MTDLADLEVLTVDDVWIAELNGEIDLSNADSIGTAVELVFAHRGKGLVLDLTAVDYLDSAGVRLIYRTLQWGGGRGWHVRVVVPAGSHIRRILDLADVPGAVRLDETRDVAVSALSASHTTDSPDHLAGDD